jgi:Co/Zn/Cd efflux system component
MSACCEDSARTTFDGRSGRYRRALLAVIAINAAMFVVEMMGGVRAGSQALLADALDFAADAATYGITLWAIGRPLRTRAMAALLKGLSLSLMALWVLGTTAWRVLVVGLPAAEVMGVIGLLAFAANLVSVLILVHWKDGDANVRSVWLCSRNDAIGNLAVIVAAGAVWITASGWPDLVVAGAMAGLFLTSSVRIVRQVMAEWRTAPATA